MVRNCKLVCLLAALVITCIAGASAVRADVDPVPHVRYNYEKVTLNWDDSVLMKMDIDIEGEVGTLTYQWYRCEGSNPNKATKIPNAVMEEYTVVGNDNLDTTIRYFCKVTNTVKDAEGNDKTYNNWYDEMPMVRIKFTGDKSSKVVHYTDDVPETEPATTEPVMTEEPTTAEPETTEAVTEETTTAEPATTAEPVTEASATTEAAAETLPVTTETETEPETTAAQTQPADDYDEGLNTIAAVASIVGGWLIGSCIVKAIIKARRK